MASQLIHTPWTPADISPTQWCLNGWTDEQFFDSWLDSIGSAHLINGSHTRFAVSGGNTFFSSNAGYTGLILPTLPFTVWCTFATYTTAEQVLFNWSGVIGGISTSTIQRIVLDPTVGRIFWGILDRGQGYAKIEYFKMNAFVATSWGDMYLNGQMISPRYTYAVPLNSFGTPASRFACGLQPNSSGTQVVEKLFVGYAGNVGVKSGTALTPEECKKLSWYLMRWGTGWNAGHGWTAGLSGPDPLVTL